VSLELEKKPSPMAKNSFQSSFKPAVLLCLIVGLSDCTALGLTVPAVAVSGGAAGVNYTFTNNAYKTISYPIADVETALDEVFKKMDIIETNAEKEENKVSISAIAGDLDIGVELEQITPTVTKIEVSAKKKVVIKDKSTATEIIVQTEKNLEDKKK
jgi:hypothetical protein